MVTRRGAFTAISLGAAAALRATAADRPMLRLESREAAVAFDLLGGGLVDFHLKDAAAINPLTWESKGEAMQARARGHFLCADRWGQPSEAERKNGMPFHGEASNVVWKQTGPASMAADLPLAQMRIERTAALDGPTLIVHERITNVGKLGRMYNMVQHPSIAPPFLDEETVVDAYVMNGFAQPKANEGLTLVGMDQVRGLTSNPSPNVVSFVAAGEVGWVTAVSPKSRLLIGYVWDTKHYPWLNLWRHVENGRPAARGLEFGTTGLHQPFGEMVRRGGRLFETPLFAYLDSGEVHERSYRAFLRAASADAKGVSKVRVTALGGIEITYS